MGELLRMKWNNLQRKLRWDFKIQNWQDTSFQEIWMTAMIASVQRKNQHCQMITKEAAYKIMWIKIAYRVCRIQLQRIKRIPLKCHQSRRWNIANRLIMLSQNHLYNSLWRNRQLVMQGGEQEKRNSWRRIFWRLSQCKWNRLKQPKAKKTSKQ